MSSACSTQLPKLQQIMYPLRSIRTLQDNVPAEAPVVGLRDATNSGSSSGGAQRSAGSTEKSLVSSSAEALYRCGHL